MHEALCSPIGRMAVGNSLAVIGAQLASSLESGRLGGTYFWVDVALVGPGDTGSMMLGERLVQTGVQCPEDETDIHRTAVRQLRDRSVRLRMSCADANELGDTPQPGESPHEGNVVLPLKTDSEWLLIVSVAGLDPTICQDLAEVIGRFILLQIPGAEFRYDTVQWRRPATEPEEAPAPA